MRVIIAHENDNDSHYIKFRMSVKNQINTQEAQSIAECFRPAYNLRQQDKSGYRTFPDSNLLLIFG
jgi:hypothetical protein